MLTLIEGGFQSSAHEEIISRIKQAVSLGKKSFLIVPEQQTVNAEAQMCKILPTAAPLVFEVTNFTRLANTAFRTLGGIYGEYCDPAKKMLIMWRTLTELSPMLTITRGRSDFPMGTVERALSAVNEMQSLGIDPDTLADAEKNVDPSDRRLKAKLNDLSLIYSTYKRLISEKYSDTGEDLTVLGKKLAKNPTFLADAEIFVEDFTSFTEPQYALIEKLMNRASVTVSLTLPRHGKDDFQYTEVRMTRDRLLRLADLATSEKRKINAPPAQRRLEIACRIADLLWHSEGTLDGEILALQGGAVKIYEASDPFEECDFVAADIKRRVMAGDRFSDIAIVARNSDSYIGILDTALAKSGIPHFISKNRGIASFEAIRLIATAYEIISRNFPADEVIGYAKCGLSGVSRDECDEFELYVERWSITGKRFTDGVTWNMNPDGYTVGKDSHGEKLRRIDEIRRKIITPLSVFRDSALKKQSVREHAECLTDFLCGIDIEDKLLRRAEELRLLGEGAEAEENERLWKIICDSLDALVETLGDVEATPETFHTLLAVLFSAVGVGRIPSHVDEVTVGSADMLRLYGKRQVYLIGVNSGEFPGTAGDNSYFTERDKAHLEALGLPIRPDLDVKSARELFCFSRALTQGYENVTLLYTRRSSSFAETRPSEAVGRISEITGGAVVPVKISELDIEDRLWSAEAAVDFSGTLSEGEGQMLRAALSDAGYGEILKISDGSLTNDSLSLSDRALGYLYGDDIYLSQTKIDTFLKCPMSYFLKYNLKLDDGQIAELGANVIGSFIHSILENFFAEAKKSGMAVGEMSQEEREKLTERAARGYITETFGTSANSPRASVAISRLIRAAKPVVDGLCDEFANCKFTPVFFELKIDGRCDTSPDPVVFSTRDGTRAIIGGIVDRVDAYCDGENTYVRVIDYKTGEKVFSPDDIQKGKNLQMFLYLKSITETDKKPFCEALGAPEGTRLIPAGVIYVKTQVKDVTVEKPDDALAVEAVKKVQERSGMLLDSTESIGAMNPDYLPVDLKGGEVAAKDKKYLYSEQSWEKIGDTIRQVVLDVCADIKGGDIHACNTDERGQSNCIFCNFRSVCRSYRPVEKFN